MNINNAFPSNYVKASDLNGRDVVVTIDRVEVEQVGRERDQKPVVYFRGKEKGLVLNKTNANSISKLYGDDTDGWAGKQITIFPTEVEFGGEQVEAIRVRLKRPASPAPAVQSKAKHPEVEPPAELAGDYDDSPSGGASMVGDDIPFSPQFPICCL